MAPYSTRVSARKLLAVADSGNGTHHCHRRAARCSAFLTANLVGRKLVELGESLLSRMPIVRPIYKTMKQIFEPCSQRAARVSGKVALVEFPAPGMRGRSCLSQPPSADLIKSLPQGEHRFRIHAVYAKPGHGLFLYVKRNTTSIELDITVENAMTR